MRAMVLVWLSGGMAASALHAAVQHPEISWARIVFWFSSALLLLVFAFPSGQRLRSRHDADC